MNCRSNVKIKPLLLVFTLVLISGPAFAKSEPQVTEALSKEIRSLSYGLAEKPSVLVRLKHVREIKARGAGRLSQSGFYFGDGIRHHGAWLRLKNRGQQRRANASLEFSPPFDATSFDSLVFWVHATTPNQRLKMTLKDFSFQSDSPIFPAKGFPVNEVVQVVVPFEKFAGSKPLDISAIEHIFFKFGMGDTGNAKEGALTVLGLAFVQQEEPLSSILLNPVGFHVVGQRYVRSEWPAVEEAESPSVWETKKVVEFENWKRQLQAAGPVFFRTVKEIWPKEKIESMASNHAAAIFSLVVLFLLLVVVRTRQSRGSKPLEHFIFRVEYPSGEGTRGIRKNESRFWEKLMQNGIRTAWISCYQLSSDSKVKEDVSGESFMRTEILKTNKRKFRLFPNLSFARTVYRYDDFLNNPFLYDFVPVAKDEQYLSDDELITRHIGFFPIWIPPHWQKKHGLPQRVLAAYGKLPQMFLSKDSIQFNLNSPDLRKLAVRVLLRFAKITSGARIEGAVAFSDQEDFWHEVIDTVREKYPKFIFIADNAGSQAKKLRNAGFDYVENDYLREIMVNQIKLQSVERLQDFLAYENTRLLAHSIYNIAPLLNRIADNHSYEPQGLLACTLLGLLPGVVEMNGTIHSELFEFLNQMNTNNFPSKNFALLETDRSSVLAMARWNRRHLCLVTANLSPQPASANVHMNPIIQGFSRGKVYRFEDVLEKSSLLNALRASRLESGFLAEAGGDLERSGIKIPFDGFGISVLMVKLDKNIVLDPSRKSERLTVLV